MAGSTSKPEQAPEVDLADNQRLVRAGPDDELMTEEEHQRMHWLAIYCSPAPEPSTEPAVRFLETGHDLMHFGGMHETLPRRMDRKVEALFTVSPEGKPKNLINYTEVSEHYSPLLSEILITRAVDAFLTYVARLLALIFTSKPETLRSGSEVKVDYILSFESRDEMIRALVDDEVDRLARLGMRELAASLQKRMGLVLFPNADQLRHAVELIEARNLIVHNGGVVNRTYLKRVPDSRQALGEKLHLFQAVNGPVSLAYAVRDIDARAITKFGLPTYDGLPIRQMCGSL